jgi:sec-independent protein translocase protein TatC
MPFLEHLEELRWRIIWSLTALLVGCVLGFFLVDRFDVLGLLKRPIAPLLTQSSGKLLFTSPTQPILITFKLALVAGILIASPVVVWQVWAFLRPALYPRERRLIVPVTLSGVVLFLGGVTLAYVWVLPLALKVLWGFQRESIEPFITVDAYFGFATMVVLAFGAIFELPLVLLLLVYFRLVSAAFLRRHRRWAVVLNGVVSAMLTPADVVSMVLMMIPVQLFYELSIVAAEVLERRRARAERLEREAPEVPATGGV